MTALYSDIIFGPIHSRRLGLSLGVNLLPTQSKLCSFDCIYCECGWNAEHPGARRFNSREDVRTMLGATLRQMVSEGTPPDVITFAGNGEPTMHPDFEAIIDDMGYEIYYGLQTGMYAYENSGDFDPATEYLVIAFGASSSTGEATTPLYKQLVTTQAAR